jgi:hypothetical protein
MHTCLVYGYSMENACTSVYSLSSMSLEPGKIKIIEGCYLLAKYKCFHCAHFDIISFSSLPLISDIKPVHDNL